jgi:uncharacterized Tic20 family protein
MTTLYDDLAIETSSESRNWASAAHLSAFITFFGIPSLFGPLGVLLARRDDPYVAHQAKEALNFNISFLLYTIAAAFSVVLVVGILILPAVLVTWFVLVIRAAIASSNGEDYEYPFTMRLIS